jgi:hypothetical protein
MPFDDSAYSARERQMMLKLVDALQLADDIYWRQADPAGLKLYLSLADSKAPADISLRRYLWINGSRFDLINENQPFVGTEPAQPGRGFYPPGMTQQRIEDFVAKHPERSKDIYNSLTVIRETKERRSGSRSVPRGVQGISGPDGAGPGGCRGVQRRSLRFRHFCGCARKRC